MPYFSVRLMRTHLTHGDYRPMIRVSLWNQHYVGRLVSLEHEIDRVWEVKTTMRDQGCADYCLIQHVSTGERRIVSNFTLVGLV